MSDQRQSAGGDPTVRFSAISKAYGEIVAVHDLTLDIAEGEFFSLLGPSGSGKTTTLRLIAGFETATSGHMQIKGRDVTMTPPHKRDIGMVFQNYALFPHKSVAQNVAFGLRMRKVSRDETVRRVEQALALVELSGYGDRRPNQLSGGQQQRVALARAVVIRPQLLLADEPLGALDRKLRQSMQFELRQFQRTVGITMVYVTHDQEEALTMSDRIGVMQHGALMQVGTPREIYDRPRNRFVADFIGTSNFLEGQVVERGDGDVTVAVAGDVRVRVELQADEAAPEKSATIALRPERIQVLRNGATAANRLSGQITGQTFLGEAMLSRVGLPSGQELLVRHDDAATHEGLDVGSQVVLGWQAADGVLVAE